MRNFIRSLIGIALIIIGWAIVARYVVSSSLLLPDPAQTLNSFLILFLNGDIMYDLYVTLMRVVWAFSLAAVIGIPIGLLLGSSSSLYGSFSFLIDFLRSMPATAIFPIFMLLFGIGDASKIAVAAFAGALVILFNTAYGVLHASTSRVLAARIMGAGKFKIFSSVLFWESLPYTFSGLRIALNFCLIIIVVTEMFIGTSAGLGRQIIDYQIVYKTNFMYAVIILTGTLGYLLNLIFAYLQDCVVHWR